MDPNAPQPFAEYNIEIEAEGYRSVHVTGTQVFPDSLALQPVSMNPMEVAEEDPRTIVVPPNTLSGEFPPKEPGKRRSSLWMNPEKLF